MRLLDLFCGRFGWSQGFAARGWDCLGIDIERPDVIPSGCRFVRGNVLRLTPEWVHAQRPDFVCISSPCDEFAVFGMRHFHPDPKFPANAVALFNHSRALCEAVGVPYIMENVRAAQQFVGNAAHHCGPFYLWGPGVPPLMAQGINKGFGAWDRAQILATGSSKSRRRVETQKAKSATIPPELSGCVADFAAYLANGSNPPGELGAGQIQQQQRGVEG